MLNRTSFAGAVLAGLAALAGCRAGTSFSGAVEFAQWTPDFAGSAQTSGDLNFDLVGTGGVDAGKDLWAIDLSLGMQAAQGSSLKPYQLNLGYWHGDYRGVGSTLSGDYLGATFTGIGPVSTDADFKYYKFTFEEPDAKTNTAGGSLSSGILGLHYLSFDIVGDDGTTRGVFSDSAPMFVIGYRIEQYTRSGLIYYIRVEWMDLDTITLGGAAGEIMDLSGGVRWAIRNKAALCIGYRQLDAELNINGNQLNMDMDGAVFSFFLSW